MSESKQIQNLKIVIENTGGGNNSPADNDTASGTGSTSTSSNNSRSNSASDNTEDKVDETVEMAEYEEDDINNEKERASDDVNEKEADGEDDDEVEFHVNLDKVPATLQNTILNEKVYLNESLKEELKSASVYDLDVISEESLQSIYASLNLTESSFESETTDQDDVKAYRKDALHVHGVDELSTNDIFDYFRGYAPLAVEWIDDSSCNVVWKNVVHAANALLKLSAMYDETEGDECMAPRGMRWRIGSKSIKHHQIFIRYARKCDRKHKGAEARSMYYMKYGNPNYGNIRGVISNSRRQRLKAEQLRMANADLDDDEDDKGDEDGDGDKEKTQSALDPNLVGDEETSKRDLVTYKHGHDLSYDLEEFGTSAPSSSPAPSSALKLASKVVADTRRDPKLFSRLGNQRPYSEEERQLEVERKRKRKNRFEPYSTDETTASSTSASETTSEFSSRKRSLPENDLRFKLNNKKKA